MRTSSDNDTGGEEEPAMQAAGLDRRKAAIVFVAVAALATAVAAGLTRSTGPATALAASHREAPLIALDPTADITDFFMFRSYEPGHEDKVVLIMDVIPGEEPSSGPNYWNFDPNVAYTISVDNDGNGIANDVKFTFRFTNQIRGLPHDLKLPLSYVGDADAGLPPITSLTGPGAK